MQLTSFDTSRQSRKGSVVPEPGLSTPSDTTVMHLPISLSFSSDVAGEGAS